MPALGAVPTALWGASSRLHRPNCIVPRTGAALKAPCHCSKQGDNVQRFFTIDRIARAYGNPGMEFLWQARSIRRLITRRVRQGNRP
jgi:hypothetical protein